MPNRYEKNIANATRLLVAMGGLVSARNLGSIVNVYDTIHEIAATPPRSLDDVADQLNEAALAAFNQSREVPKEADVLFVQMVKLGLLSPREIVTAGMDAEACAKAMLAKLSNENDPTGEMRRAEMTGLFASIVTDTLAPLLESKGFAADLTPAYFAEILERTSRTEKKIDRVADALENLEAQTRDTLDNLALRFGELEPQSLSLSDIRAFLYAKASEYRVVRQELESLKNNTINTEKDLTAIEEAIRTADFFLAEHLLTERQRVQLDQSAETALLRLRVLILTGRSDEAVRVLKASARSYVALNEGLPVLKMAEFLDWIREDLSNSSLTQMLTLPLSNGDLDLSTPDTEHVYRIRYHLAAAELTYAMGKAARYRERPDPSSNDDEIAEVANWAIVEALLMEAGQQASLALDLFSAENAKISTSEEDYCNLFAGALTIRAGATTALAAFVEHGSILNPDREKSREEAKAMYKNAIYEAENARTMLDKFNLPGVARREQILRIIGFATNGLHRE